ncbi:MAG: capsule biosynthesis protein CapG [Clostridia bacterium]|nr:capsule biosynthesis protein CapG [Clostridia bacterium]
MNRFIKLIYWALYRLHIVSSVKVAKKMGVCCGNGCRILDNPFKVFGSEPFLIKLGDNVEITNGTRIITHDGGLWVLRNCDIQFKKADFFSPVKIGNNVFIGVNTIILPGVTIGNNVVIGAGSVITKDIPSNSVVCGVPARVVKNLDEYKKSKISSIVNTKGLSCVEKREFLEKAYPKWFGETK